jgi:hypothetical protein
MSGWLGGSVNEMKIFPGIELLDARKKIGEQVKKS